eukprot:15670734-Heterocapsa_arctica.AAC.1
MLMNADSVPRSASGKRRGWSGGWQVHSRSGSQPARSWHLFWACGVVWDMLERSYDVFPDTFAHVLTSQ